MKPAATMEKNWCCTRRLLGLNTCWVGLTYSKVKDAFVLEDGEKLYCVISNRELRKLTQGIPHKSKPFEKVGRRRDAILQTGNAKVWKRRCLLPLREKINRNFPFICWKIKK